MTRRRLLIIGVALGTLVAAAGATAAWLWGRSKPHSIEGSPTTEFVTTAAPEVEKRPPTLIRTEPWPTYGLDAQRTRLALNSPLRPPFKLLWHYRAGSLVEFPPPIAYGALYVPVERGLVVALDVRTGKVLWSRPYRACIGASPAVAHEVVYVAMLNPCNQPHTGEPGLVVALKARTGRELWRFRLGATESSPLIVGNRLYVGSRDDRLYALNATTGRLRWSFNTGGEIKGAPAYADGTVYTASYDGYVYALDAHNGHLRWKAGAENALLGGRGTFYANPAIAYGRVFIGNTDGVVYAFGATSGSLLWARKTGGYVYGSAAIWKQTIYVGSYDHHFYALDASTGDVRWTFDTNGPISGSATVMDGIVYFSTLAGRTYGLDAQSGRQVWTFPDGQYSPLVADRTRVYLVGHAGIYALEPRRR